MRLRGGLLSQAGRRVFGRGRTVLLAALIAGAVVGISQASAGTTSAVVMQSNTATLPSDAKTTPTVANLSSVSCASASSCFAAGNYLDTSNHQQAMVVPITGGTAETAQEITLPNASTTSPDAMPSSVSCASASSCVAVGSYFDASNHQQAMVVPITSGTAKTAQKIALPNNAASNPYATIWSVSCASTGSCVAAGDYAGTGGATPVMVVPITGGTAGTAQKVTLPSGNTNPSADFASVSCASTGSCVAVGTYTDTSSNTQVMVVPITGGTAGTAQKVTLPSPASNPSAVLNAVSCASTGSCVAAGKYNDTSGAVPALAVSIQQPLAITTGSLPKAKIGIRYHTTLNASGGIGTYTWSIPSGHLPKGLTLNHSTGKISGIPKRGGKFSITFKVKDPGAPAQTTTGTLTLKVAKPLIRIPKGALRLHGHRVIAPLHCTRARCVGNLKLRYKTASGKTITIGHHKFNIRPGHKAKLKVLLNSTALGAIATATDHRIRVLEIAIVKHGPNKKKHKIIR